MKKILLIAICGLFAISSRAQSTTDEITLMQSAFGLSKKQLVVDLMKFSDEESKKFWPLYDKYEDARTKLGKSRIDNIMLFAKNYDAMTNEKATELVNLALKTNADFTKLQQKTFTEMSAAITPIRAAQFIQLEVYLENALRMELSDQIPLIKKVEEKKAN
jgi:hypothetical protein